MSNQRIVIDGETVMDGDPGAWVQASLEEITDSLKRGERPKPWRQPLLMLLATAVAQEKSTNFEVTTLAKGFTLTVEEQ